MGGTQLANVPSASKLKNKTTTNYSKIDNFTPTTSFSPPPQASGERVNLLSQSPSPNPSGIRAFTMRDEDVRASLQAPIEEPNQIDMYDHPWEKTPIYQHTPKNPYVSGLTLNQLGLPKVPNLRKPPKTNAPKFNFTKSLPKKPPAPNPATKPLNSFVSEVFKMLGGQAAACASSKHLRPR